MATPYFGTLKFWWAIFSSLDYTRVLLNFVGVTKFIFALSNIGNKSNDIQS